MTTAATHVQKLLDAFRQRRPMRAGSLIVTLFGDTISQHGNRVWLGSVINALEPFGLNQRLVRTAVYRLMQDDWLCSTQVGRKSFYSFTETGLRHYQKAARRIYAPEYSSQDGDWLFVHQNNLPEKQRELLRKELHWLGFGNLFPGVMAKPGADRLSLDETLKELGLQQQVVVMRSQPDDQASAQQLKSRVYACWNLEQLEQQYRAMYDVFSPLLERLNSGDSLVPEAAFQLRTLLIHDYRRLLLKDAELPESLLPEHWVGRQVYSLVADIYRHIQQGSESYVMEALETTDGPLPTASSDYFARFGQLA
ncbi:phenylacetic acid degradation operon negative regulatory protein PaaX [Porticoccus sp. W117]|uniref:phenylacetic acid degradation operon negative regulatory protein PaaX n=1 Tax=Porticoccus sp. W117 TaxID=3054777 RepID=UPI002592C738|nr:phenylacetic acid degradation operon negative regulatory protein PaaX [Porticoccus sp. W117]MDM3872509.1 phenylacetic acid degradation operon negative regulatory protein PaaX [Porticoccus sp. W117]